MNTRLILITAFALPLTLAACGGGSDSSESNATATSAKTAGLVVSGATVAANPSTQAMLADNATLASAPATVMANAAPTAASRAQASHFLAQATFGATNASISTLTGTTQSAWINTQFQVPQTLHRLHLVEAAASGVWVGQNQVFETFWKQAATGKDQLRQRVAYALSQIFVISMGDAAVNVRTYGVADYYDMLGRNAFGNFRTLLEDVARHPMMGLYLSHLRNQKENGARMPDENFAREIMQLMSLGVYQLNQDGSLKTSGGQPIETYSHADVMGLAKVFTGWSWGGPDRSDNRFSGAVAAADRDWTPMQNYPGFHSSSTKTFLGVSTNGTGEADLKVALDTLFNHPNVGPFFGRLLIQRLVSSNPSPAYISRVAAAFNNNGAGVRGDMRAVIRAVLLDPEAASNGSAKKLREPVLRLANWMRAFNAKSNNGRFLMTQTDDAVNGLGQSPFRSPSVFNFYRPSYTPPNTSLSAASMVAPEMQITGEPSVIGYLNFMQLVVPYGTGVSRDIVPDYSAELALAAQPAQLVDHLALLLMGGEMSSTMRNQLVTAVTALPVPTATASNAQAVTTAKTYRVWLAIYLTMASPEYLAQR